MLDGQQGQKQICIRFFCCLSFCVCLCRLKMLVARISRDEDAARWAEEISEGSMGKTAWMDSKEKWHAKKWGQMQGKRSKEDQLIADRGRWWTLKSKAEDAEKLGNRLLQLDEPSIFECLAELSFKKKTQISKISSFMPRSHAQICYASWIKYHPDLPTVGIWGQIWPLEARSALDLKNLLWTCNLQTQPDLKTHMPILMIKP